MSQYKKGKNTHDRKVREVARNLRRQGYSVKADIRGYDGRPATVGKARRRPDIEATKWSRGRVVERRIVEVETKKSLQTDKEQIKTFVRHAAHKKGTSFDLVITRSRQSRSEKGR